MSGARDALILRTAVPRRRSMDLRRPIPHLPIFLLVASIIAGCAGVLSFSQIGSGDYGQWLMVARSYVPLPIPAYRADDAVPPVVPLLIAWVERMVGDPVLALHLFAAGLLCVLAVAGYLCASTLFRSRLAGLGALVASFLFTDRFLDLFAFGGLLQAAAVALLWLAIAAFVAAGRDRPREWVWWTAGAACVGAGAVTHIGTAAISIPVTVAVAVLVSLQHPTWRERLTRLVPLGAVLLVSGVYGLIVLAPGGTELTRNPASIDYRGPGRLVETLTAEWPSVIVIGAALAGIVVGVVAELRTKRPAAWTILAAWTGITLAILGAAVVAKVATDYPRFATPVLAPLVIAAGALLATGAEALAREAARRVQRGTSAGGWTLGIVAAVVLACIPATVGSFETAVIGYRLTDQASLSSAASWISANVPSNATILAPVREAKWLEGLTGRATLFSSAIRYSFRPDEWERSFAADALLRSNAALLNEFFVARFTDAGTTQVPRGLTIAANHGGEYVDLLRTVPAETRIFANAPNKPTLALVQNLEPANRVDTATIDQARVSVGWRGVRQGAPVVYNQGVTLLRGSSTLALEAVVSTPQKVGGFVITLRPAGADPVVSATRQGGAVELTFGRLGTREPRLRIVPGRGNTLTLLADGRLQVSTAASRLRVLITDLTGAAAPRTGLQILHPADLVARYDVTAAVLPIDGNFDGRQARLGSLGFRVATTFGPYAVLVRDLAVPRGAPR